jgi:hypothetical protein
MTKKKPAKTKLTVKKNDPAESDKRIPRNLIMTLGEEYYILKAGLEWKANDLFGGAGYSLMIEPVTMDYEKQRFVFKATLVVLENNAVYINFGEATAKNVKSLMSSQLLHLAVTRAECRVLRMATACGYASYDEVQTQGNGKKVEIENGDKPASKEQIATINSLIPSSGVKGYPENITKQEASNLIKELSEKK